MRNSVKETRQQKQLGEEVEQNLKKGVSSIGGLHKKWLVRNPLLAMKAFLNPVLPVSKLGFL